MFALLALGAALPPVILVPPMFGSHLHAKSDGISETPWYCPRKFDEKAIWCSETMLIPPNINCCGEYMKCGWDPVAKRGTSRVNETVWTPDFGGDEAIKYIDTGILGVHFVSDMKRFEDALFAKGYVLKQDLFGAPYDCTTSFRPGTRFASAAMRRESYGLELYSPYQDKELTDRAVLDAGDIELPFGDPAPALAAITNYRRMSI